MFGVEFCGETLQNIVQVILQEDMDFGVFELFVEGRKAITTIILICSFLVKMLSICKYPY